jgi:hypothetical protein
MALRATMGDENPQRPDGIRPQDAILPRNALRASSQRSAFSCQLAGVRLSARLGGLSGRIVAARKDSQV